ncbi:hypothetical protein [Variovorax boronicumulans]
MQDIRPINLTPPEYLAQITDSQKREEVTSWVGEFDFMAGNVEFLFDIYVEVFTELRISDTDDVGMQGNEYAIYVNRGHIDYCYALDESVLEAVEDPNVRNIAVLPGFVGRIAFLWSLAHEFFHGARAHNTRIDSEAEKRRHERGDLERALEYDADLCAVVYIYRYLQKRARDARAEGAIPVDLSDSTIRQVAICMLFAALRGLPDASSDAGHPARVNRLVSFVAKLATVGERDEDPIDRNLTLPETRAQAGKILECLCRCEKKYQEIHGKRNGDLFFEMEGFFKKIDMPYLDAWTSMDEEQIRLSDERASLFLAQKSDQAGGLV